MSSELVLRSWLHLKDDERISIDCKQALEALFVQSLLKSIESPTRTRINIARDPAAAFDKLVNLPSTFFFEQFRMSRDVFEKLSKGIAPFFRRDPSRRGPKPAPFVYMLLFTLRLLAQGLQSWSAFAIDHDIGRATLMNDWVPNVCIAIILAFPLPKRLRRGGTAEWEALANGFKDLARTRVPNDTLSGVKWREALPTAWEPLLPVAEVFDVLQTPLREKPRGLGPRSQEYIHYKTNRYSLNNLVGVDSRGRISTALIGAPGSVSDSRLFEQLELFKAMERNRPQRQRGQEQIINDYRMPRNHKVLADSGFKLRTWVLTPYTAPAILKAPNPYAFRVYNFRLSQTRVVSENCFGRLKARWCILRDLPFSPETAALIVHCCFCLHTFLEELDVPVRRSWLDELTAQDIMSTDFDTVTTASVTTDRSTKATRERIATLFQ